MKRLVLLAPPLALLSACSGSAVSLQPGQWETTTQFTSIEIPGAPAPQVAAMRQMMGQPRTEADCMTPEEAANPTSTMMNAGSRPDSCRFSESTFAGGTIRVRGTCEEAGRGRMQMSVDGSYTATTMEGRISAEVTAPAGTPADQPQSVRMSGTLTGRRTGECTP